MSTTLINPAAQAAKVIVLSVTDDTIDAMEKRMLSVRVNGITDKEGRELAHKCKMECVKARSAITAAHKDQKSVALQVCQELDAEKRRLTSRVEEIEGHLVDQLEAVAREEARIQQEKDDAIYADRVAKLAEHDAVIPEAVLRAMSPATFAESLAQSISAASVREEREAAEAAAELERKRLADAEAERNRIEAQRLAAEREEFRKQQAELAKETARLKAIEDEKLAKERQALEAQRQEQARKEAELKAEQDRLAKIEAERLQAIEQERVAAAAAERARIETEERLERERKTAEANRLAEEAAKKRAEELQPAKAKLAALSHAILTLPTPTISQEIDGKVLAVMNNAAEAIRLIAKGMA